MAALFSLGTANRASPSKESYAAKNKGKVGAGWLGALRAQPLTSPGPLNQTPLPLFLHLKPESVMTAVTSEGYLEELARHSLTVCAPLYLPDPISSALPHSLCPSHTS